MSLSGGNWTEFGECDIGEDEEDENALGPLGNTLLCWSYPDEEPNDGSDLTLLAYLEGEVVPYK